MFERILALTALVPILVLAVWPSARRYIINLLVSTSKVFLSDAAREFLKGWTVHITAMAAASLGLFILATYFGIHDAATFIDFLRAVLRELQLPAISTVITVLNIAILIVALVWYIWKRDAFAVALRLKALGFTRSWPDLGQDHKTSPWTDLYADIKHPDNDFVYILGANGRDTFGGPQSGLYNVLEEFSGAIHVMLINPNCDEMKRRAMEVTPSAKRGTKDFKTSVDDYKHAIETSIQRLGYLKSLREPGRHNIKWCLYSDRPRWKIIITKRAAWVQYYMPRQHVDSTPIYRFEPKQPSKDLYHLFFVEFALAWDRYDRDHEFMKSSVKRK